jgi:hypothetical protein
MKGHFLSTFLEVLFSRLSSLQIKDKTEKLNNRQLFFSSFFSLQSKLLEKFKLVRQSH